MITLKRTRQEHFDLKFETYLTLCSRWHVSRTAKGSFSVQFQKTSFWPIAMTSKWSKG